MPRIHRVIQSGTTRPIQADASYDPYDQSVDSKAQAALHCTTAHKYGPEPPLMHLMSGFQYKTRCYKQHAQSLRVDVRCCSEWRATLASNVRSSLANICTPRCLSLSQACTSLRPPLPFRHTQTRGRDSPLLRRSGQDSQTPTAVSRAAVRTARRRRLRFRLRQHRRHHSLLPDDFQGPSASTPLAECPSSQGGS